MANRHNRPRRRRQKGLIDTDPMSVGRFFRPPLPKGGDPSFECPKTGERITITTCLSCEQFGRWGDSESRSCRLDYERLRDIEDETCRATEETLRRNEQLSEEEAQDRVRAAEEFRKFEERADKLREYHAALQEASYLEFQERADEMLNDALRGFAGEDRKEGEGQDEETWNEWDEDSEER